MCVVLSYGIKHIFVQKYDSVMLEAVDGDEV